MTRPPEPIYCIRALGWRHAYIELFHLPGIVQCTGCGHRDTAEASVLRGENVTLRKDRNR